MRDAEIGSIFECIFSCLSWHTNGDDCPHLRKVANWERIAFFGNSHRDMGNYRLYRDHYTGADKLIGEIQNISLIVLSFFSWSNGRGSNANSS